MRGADNLMLQPDKVAHTLSKARPRQGGPPMGFYIGILTRWAPPYGGVHKIQILIRDLLKDFFYTFIGFYIGFQGFISKFVSAKRDSGL